MNKKIIFGGIVVTLILIMGFILNGKTPVNDDSQKISVMTSFYPLYFLATEIGGDKAEVINITPAGAEPHEYELTARDLVNIEESHIVVLNGAGLEPWAKDATAKLNPATVVVRAGEGLANREVIEDGKRVIDPHVWLSPILMQKMADKISEAFLTADPLNSDYYRENLSNLKTRLANLDEEYRAALRNCLQKNIVTSHVAFGYLASSYGFNQLGLTGLSPDSEPSVRELAEITKFAKDNKIKHIFFESLVSPKLAETIASEIGAETLVLNPLEGLTKEELASNKNYFTEMRTNLANLKIALQCQN